MEEEKVNKWSAFWKRRDRYAVPINLTYNQLNRYPTIYGGYLSVLSMVLLMTWLAVNILNIVQYKFSLDQNQDLIALVGHPKPVFGID